MIELKNVHKTFNQGRPNEFSAVRGVTLSIAPRKVTVLRGPSGSGKSTLLGLIGCLARPTSGRIFLDPAALAEAGPQLQFPGGEVTSLPERFLAEIRRHTFGFIFQQFHLVRGLTVLENVMLPAYPLGRPFGELKQRALSLLDAWGLSAKAQDKVEWLSGGETQRVTIARAQINAPRVIIADEPTAHLDTVLARGFLDALATLRAQNTTVIVASHDPLVCEAAVVDETIAIRDGRIENLTPEDVL